MWLECAADWTDILATTQCGCTCYARSDARGQNTQVISLASHLIADYTAESVSLVFSVVTLTAF